MRSSSVDNGDQVPLEGELDLGGIGRALARKRGIIAGVTLLALVGSVGFVTIVKPRYTAESKILVENQESYFTRPDRGAQDSSAQAPDAEAITSQVQLVTSRDLAREAIRQLDLKGNAEFDPAAAPPSLASRLLVLLGLRRSDETVSPEDRMLENYFDRLNVFAVTKSRVIQVEFTSWSPELASRAANLVADLYINLQADAKRGNARIAAASLGTLIADLRTKVATAESRAEAFRASNGLMVGSNSLSMSGQQLADLNAQLTVARGAEADARAKAQLIRDQLRSGRVSEVPDVANNDLVRRLSEQRAALRGQIASESRTLLPGHPRIKELTAQLSQLESEIRDFGEKTARTLENDARLAGSRVENLQAALDQQKKAVGGSSGDEARARELDREARVMRDQLEASTAKYQEALVRQSSESTPGDARMISRASAPQLASFPKKGPIILFAVLAALILSSGMVVAAELLSGRAYVRGARPLSAPGGGAALRPVGQGPTTGVRAVSAQTGRAKALAHPSPFDDRFGETAVSGLAGRIVDGGHRTQCARILVTMVDRSVDASDVAMSLGRALSREHRAILIDTGFAPPTNGDAPVGLSELLVGHVGFDASIHRDPGSRLHLVPAGRAAVTADEGLLLVVEALSQTYDYVLLLASIEDASIIGALAPLSDFTVLACEVDVADVSSTEAHGVLVAAGAHEIFAVAVGTEAGEPSRHVA